MKPLILLGALLLSHICMAGPTAPVSHSHNGRTHTHPLPANGIAHRHGSGALGQRVSNSNRPYKIRPNATRPNSGITSHVETIGKNPARPSAPKPIKRQPYSSTKGDVNCRPGETSCNVCVNNVQAQFQQAASRKISWRRHPWRFRWPQKYAPNGLRPLDIFDGKPAYALGIPDTHIQGFVRTNSSRYPFAGSHSHKRRGGIFVVQQDGRGNLSLASLFRTKGRHPSGVQVIGKFLVYAEHNQLIFKDLNSKNQNRDYRLKIKKPSFGGGLGITRLSSKEYLVITSGPGGQGRRPRYHRFYRLTFAQGRPRLLKYLGESASSVPSNWPRAYAYSENLSLMTECGTGDIYTVHTSGDEKGVSAIRGKGYWRLSRLEERSGKLALRSLNAFSIRQNMTSCNVRAAATVHVNPQHKLEFYCHGYAKDPDGSTFNVLGPSSRNADRFNFQRGTLN